MSTCSVYHFLCYHGLWKAYRAYTLTHLKIQSLKREDVVPVLGCLVQKAHRCFRAHDLLASDRCFNPTDSLSARLHIRTKQFCGVQASGLLNRHLGPVL